MLWHLHRIPTVEHLSNNEADKGKMSKLVLNCGNFNFRLFSGT